MVKGAEDKHKYPTQKTSFKCFRRALPPRFPSPTVEQILGVCLRGSLPNDSQMAGGSGATLPASLTKCRVIWIWGGHKSGAGGVDNMILQHMLPWEHDTI